MHSVLTRLTALFWYTMYVLVGLTFMCFLSTFLFVDHQTAAKADINTVNVVVKHVPDFSASREKVTETTMMMELLLTLYQVFG